MKEKLSCFLIAVMAIAFTGCGPGELCEYKTMKNCIKSPDGKREACEVCKAERGRDFAFGTCWLEHDGKRSRDNDGHFMMIKFSPDSKHLVYAGRHFLNGLGYTIYFDDKAIGRTSSFIELPKSFVFSNDGNHILYFVSGDFFGGEEIAIDGRWRSNEISDRINSETKSEDIEIHPCSDSHFLTTASWEAANGQKNTQVFLDQHLVYEDAGEVESFVCGEETVQLNLATPLATGAVKVNIGNPLRIYPCSDNHFLAINREPFGDGLQRVMVFLDGMAIFLGTVEIKSFACDKGMVELSVVVQETAELKYDLKGKEIK